MKIICAGAPKTGTKTMTKALRILGYDQVFDVEESIDFAFDEWEDMFENRVPNMDKIFDSYEAQNVQAVVDMPHSYLFDKFLERWPNAKVILTMRDEDSWFKSFENMIIESQKYRFISFLTPLSKSLRRFINFTMQFSKITFGSYDPHPFLWKAWYRRHNAYVKLVVPEDKLLIFNVKEGWTPLCEFLGKSIPDEDFPTENRAAGKNKIVDRLMQDTKIVKQSQKEVMVSFALIALAVSVVVGYFVF